MPGVLTGNPACGDLVRIGFGTEPGRVGVGDTACEDEIELMLAYRTTGLFPIDFSDMHQFRDGNVGTDFFAAFPFQSGNEVLARFLLSTGQREVPAFHRVLFFLDQ